MTAPSSTALPGAAGPFAQCPTPGLARRMACFLYEGVLLFGIVMTAGLFYAGLTQQRHALQGQTGLQITLFLTFAAYFGWFWSRSGQTLAMKTWHIRVVTLAGHPVSRVRALARYLASWLWFIPALAIVHRSGLHGPVPVFTALTVGVLGYAGLALMHPDRQFWHDALCGTRLVTWRPAPRAKSGG